MNKHRRFQNRHPPFCDLHRLLTCKTPLTCLHFVMFKERLSRISPSPLSSPPPTIPFYVDVCVLSSLPHVGEQVLIRTKTPRLSRSISARRGMTASPSTELLISCYLRCWVKPTRSAWDDGRIGERARIAPAEVVGCRLRQRRALLSGCCGRGCWSRSVPFASTPDVGSREATE